MSTERGGRGGERILKIMVGGGEDSKDNKMKTEEKKGIIKKKD